PHTPLCLSTKLAKSGHVVSSRGFTPKPAIVTSSFRWMFYGSAPRGATSWQATITPRLASVAGTNAAPAARSGLQHELLPPPAERGSDSRTALRCIHDAPDLEVVTGALG